MALTRRSSSNTPKTQGSAPAAKPFAAPLKKKKTGGAKGQAKDTKNWYTDRYQYVLVQRNILALITLAALGATLFLAITISQMSPLKSVKPFIIQVDDKSGVTNVVSDGSKKELEANEALKRYFIIKYVTARESYDPEFGQVFFNTARLMSSPDVFREYNRQISPDNPESLTNILGSESRRSVKFKSIVFLEPDLAQIRIKLTYSGKKTSVIRGGKEEDAVVLVRFKFVRLELTQEERDVNPLGFRVEHYRIDQETMS